MSFSAGVAPSVLADSPGGHEPDDVTRANQMAPGVEQNQLDLHET